jgi:hypothetical protein
VGLIGRSAAQILEQGEVCQAVIVQSQPLGMRDQKGDDMYAFMLRVVAEGRTLYQIRVGNPVPAAALPLLREGSALPARLLHDGDDRDLAIDWDAAISRMETAAAP